MCRRAVLLLLLPGFVSGPAGAATTHGGIKGQQGQHEAGSTAAARAARSEAAVEQMMRADVNKDGAVSRDELERLDSRLSRNFDAADADRDGKLTLREFERLRVLSRGATSGATAGGSATGSGPAARR